MSWAVYYWYPCCRQCFCHPKLAILTQPSLNQVLGLCAYRIWFHPLSKYPGPTLAKLSNLYSAYYAWTGDIHIDMWRCHQKYGTDEEMNWQHVSMPGNVFI